VLPRACTGSSTEDGTGFTDGASYSEKPVFEKGTQPSVIENTAATALRCYKYPHPLSQQYNTGWEDTNRVIMTSTGGDKDKMSAFWQFKFGVKIIMYVRI
jgi:hypothetical protein